MVRFENSFGFNAFALAVNAALVVCVAAGMAAAIAPMVA
jgi:hypothetical protein